MSARRAAALLALAGCQTALPEPTPLQATGRITIVDSGGPGGDTGYWPSLRTDAEDRVHLAWCDLGLGDLRYAVRDAGGWRTEAVATEGAVGKYAALAVDGAGRPAVAYYDQDHKLLRFARRGAEGWQSEPVAFGLEIGVGAQMWLAEDDVAHLFYYAPQGRFVHATRARDGAWRFETLAEAGGGFSARPSVVRRADGFWSTLVAWDLERASLLLVRPGHSSPRVLARDAGFASALSFVGDEPSVVYAHAGDLALLHRDASRRLVADAGAFAAARSAQGELVVAYQRRRGGGTLELVRDAGGSRARRIVIDAEAPVADHVSLTLDSRDRATVAYHSGRIRGLKVYEEREGP